MSKSERPDRSLSELHAALADLYVKQLKMEGLIKMIGLQLDVTDDVIRAVLFEVVAVQEDFFYA